MHQPHLASHQPAFTRHARRRQQQRVIPQVIIEAILDYGEAHRTPDGKAWRWRFGKRGWKRFAAFMGPMARHYERYRRAYLVTSPEGALLTVAWDWR